MKHHEEEVNIDLLHKSPLEFSIKEQSEAEKLWPYSVGIEIECDKAFDYREEFFKAIPDIMDVNTDNSEQRYRLPSGIKGMICLWNLCDNLVKYSLVNMESGIHYHIDFTDCYNDVTENLCDDDKNFILTELDTWGYKGNYNSRIVSKLSGGAFWIRFQNSFKTMECRIGEMTFHYHLLLKRILHLQSISMIIKERCTANQSLRKFIKEHKFDEPETKSFREIEQIVKRRVIKL